MSDQRVVTVPISDPEGYPYAILTRRERTGDHELHFLPETGGKVEWAVYAERLRRSREFSRVEFCTLGLMTDEGRLLGG
jgi:hypothetical protein